MMNNKSNVSNHSPDNNQENPINNTVMNDKSSRWLVDFMSVYQRLSTDNLDLLASIYHPNIAFMDPIHKLNGFDQLSVYFAGLYENLTSCDFVIEHHIQQGSEASLFWKMTYQHPKLNKGKDVVVYGTSHIKSEDGKVIYHRDFLDLGAMLYEQLPVLGKIIKLIKEKAAK